MTSTRDLVTPSSLIPADLDHGDQGHVGVRDGGDKAARCVHVLSVLLFVVVVDVVVVIVFIVVVFVVVDHDDDIVVVLWYL